MSSSRLFATQQRIRLAVLAAAMCTMGAVWPSVSSAQAVSGVVADLETAQPLGDASIRLVDSLGFAAFATSDSRGQFHLEVPAGVYALSVRLIGYKPASAQLPLFPGAAISVRVNLVEQAVVLEPLVVVGENLTEGQLEFESRRDLAYAFAFDRDSIDQMTYATQIRDVIDQGVPGGTFARCFNIYLDGRDRIPGGYPLTEYPLDWIYGIEVFLTHSDVPLRYRYMGRDYNTGCGSILLWSNIAPEQQARPKHWTFGGGLSPGIERWLLEVGWRPGNPDMFVLAVRARFGRYSPYSLLGTEYAAAEEYHPDLRPGYGSLHVGAQGPVPFLPWGRTGFLRATVGGSYYFGQKGGQVAEGDSLRVVRHIGAFFGIGPELALGARLPSGKIRPWAEIRIGTEYLGNVGAFRLVGPVFAAGIEIGRMEF
jgi:hypothetical protein